MGTADYLDDFSNVTGNNTNDTKETDTTVNGTRLNSSLHVHVGELLGNNSTNSTPAPSEKQNDGSWCCPEPEKEKRTKQAIFAGGVAGGLAVACIVGAATKAKCKNHQAGGCGCRRRMPTSRLLRSTHRGSA